MTFYSAILLGLLASLHCAGMCGGLQSVLQRTQIIRSPRQTTLHLLALNGGRISTYIVMGLVLGALGRSIITGLDIPLITQFTRSMTALVLLLLGLKIIYSPFQPFRWLERLGARVWARVSANEGIGHSTRLAGSYRMGLIWGFLPCGLVYGVLLSTLFADSYHSGALIMAGFGLGTVPSMLLTGGMYQGFRNVIRAPASRLVGGAVFIQAGVLMLVAPLIVSTGFMANYPIVMQQMFCFN